MKLDALSRAAAHRDQAALALDAADAAGALSSARQALALCPDDPAARLLEARALVALQRGREALAALDALERIGPAETDHPLTIDTLRLAALRQAKRPDLALRLAERRWRDDRNDVAAAHAVVALRLERGDPAGARAALRRMVEHGLASSRDCRQYAALAAVRDPQAAIAALEAGADADPVTRLMLARLCVRAQRLSEADEHYRALLSGAADNATVWVEAGRLAMRLGLHEAATARLTQALKLPGDHHDEARTALAVALMHAGRFAAAGRQWWILSRSASAPLAGWAGLLVCALVTGRDALTRRAEAQLRSHTSNTERRRMLAGLWREAAGPAAVRQALASPRANTTPRSVLADMVRDAAHVLAAQARDTPSRADVHYHHAVLEAARGDPVTAQLAVSRALTINPRYDAAAALARRLTPPLRLAA